MESLLAVCSRCLWFQADRQEWGSHAETMTLGAPQRQVVCIGERIAFRSVLAAVPRLWRLYISLSPSWSLPWGSLDPVKLTRNGSCWEFPHHYRTRLLSLHWLSMPLKWPFFGHTWGPRIPRLPPVRPKSISQLLTNTISSDFFTLITQSTGKKEALFGPF